MPPVDIKHGRKLTSLTFSGVSLCLFVCFFVRFLLVVNFLKRMGMLVYSCIYIFPGAVVLVTFGVFFTSFSQTFAIAGSRKENGVVCPVSVLASLFVFTFVFITLFCVLELSFWPNFLILGWRSTRRGSQQSQGVLKSTL